MNDEETLEMETLELEGEYVEGMLRPLLTEAEIEPRRQEHERRVALYQAAKGGS